MTQESALQIMNNELEELNIENYENPLDKFNKQLLNQTNTQLSMQEYMDKVIKSDIYNVENFDFMNVFMYLIPIKKPCINAKYLWKCGVLTGRYDTYLIKRKLENIKKVLVIAPKDGLCLIGSNSLEYYLTPKLFKKFLMRSKNTDVYADYYQFLEDCVYYYSQFQHLYKDRQLQLKDDKIDNLEKLIKSQSLSIENFKQEAMGEIKKSAAENQEINKKLDKSAAENQEIKQELKQTNSILHKVVIDRVQYSKNKKKMQHLKFIELPDNWFVIITGQQPYINMVSKSKSPIIGQFTINNTPNNIHLRDNIFEEIKDIIDERDDREKYKFKINNFTIDDIKYVAYEVFNRRLNTNQS